jgi:hypothetical protein
MSGLDWIEARIQLQSNPITPLTTSAASIQRVHRLGAQAIVGSFMSMTTGVAEAEAHIATIREQFWGGAIKLWVEIHTLPGKNPLRKLSRRNRAFRRFIKIGFH